MFGLRTASVPARALLALMLALLLALRVVGSAGYMPSFDRDALTIIVCPDADYNSPLALGSPHHHHGNSKHAHQPCPYAAASSLGAAMAGMPLLAPAPAIGLALLIGWPSLFLEPRRAHERPPLRGPPLPA